MPHNRQNLDEIQREIQATRSHAAATVAELEQRLSAGALLDQAVDFIRNNQTGRALVANFRQTVVENPVPLAMVVVGVGWLMAAGARRPAYPAMSPARGLEHGSDRGKAPRSHHVHVEHVDPNAPEGVPPSPNVLVGEELAGKPAAESAEVFERGEPSRQAGAPGTPAGPVAGGPFAAGAPSGAPRRSPAASPPPGSPRRPPETRH